MKTLYGVEFEAIKSLDSIWPGSRLLNKISIGLNGALMQSSVLIDKQEYKVRSEIDPEVSKIRLMYALSLYLLNGHATYKHHSMDLTVTINYAVLGKRLVLVSQGKLPDVYELSRPSLGLATFRSIGTKFQLSFSARNLLNPATKFVHEYEEKDYIYSSYKRGMTFSLGLKYTI